MSKGVTLATWWDVPHLSDKDRDEMLASTPPHLRDARAKGIPTVGSGLIYPVSEDVITVEDFPLPVHWKKAYGLDVGWNRTAAIFGVWDADSDIVYLYSEHYVGKAEPAVHAAAIKARGNMRGVIDPASRGRSQHDGSQLMVTYNELGLQISKANNAVEAGIYEMWSRFSSGRLKIFKSCRAMLTEYRLYRRDEKGHIVKENDHLMDAARYLLMSMPHVMSYVGYEEPKEEVEVGVRIYDGNWMN